MTDEADQADVDRAIERREQTLESSHANQIRLEIEGRHIQHETAPDELALFPAESGEDVTHEWIVATGSESFVELEEMR